MGSIIVDTGLPLTEALPPILDARIATPPRLVGLRVIGAARMVRRTTTTRENPIPTLEATEEVGPIRDLATTSAAMGEIRD